ncbi:hypothetical protein [Nocardia sp. NPDC059239]|uniref:hypothetical protein n=1 Tax=unclassified Nocardia TaxID=2637762 RepID=UPI0036C598A4
MIHAIDEKMHSHPKTLRIQRNARCAAIGLWTLAMSWCDDHDTGGLVPAYVVEEFGATKQVAEWLVTVGYWESAEDGYRIPDWPVDD